MKQIRKWTRLWAVLLAVFLLGACGSAGNSTPEASVSPVQEDAGSAGTEDEETRPEAEEPAGSEAYADPGESGDAETPEEHPSEDAPKASEAQEQLPEDGTYTSKEEVAEYIHQYGHLPDNFLTKKEAQALGWEGGSLEPYAPGMCIGGSRFGNYEGLLPEADGRTYTECDIDTLGADRRGAKRIVFSNDGLIYYTEDHYESFELLYGEEP